MSQEPKYTKVGSGLAAWEPWLSLFESRDGDPGERPWLAAKLWLALYTSTHAKLMPPGLWLGGVGTMADTARMSPGDTHEALEILIARELVEFDPKHQVLRLTKLPDRCERAPNKDCLNGWYGRYTAVPDCGVKERYLELIAWMHLPIIARYNPKARAGMEEAWAFTFGAALEAALPSIRLSTASMQVPHRTAPKQLDLYSARPKTDRPPHRPPDGPVPEEEQVPEEDQISEALPLRPSEGSAAPPTRESGAGPALYVVGDAPETLRLAPQRESLDDVATRTGHDRELLVALSDGEVVDLFDEARRRLRARMQPQAYEMWLGPLSCRGREGRTLRLEAPNAYVAGWFRDHHAADLKSEIYELTGAAMEIAVGH